MSSSGVAYCLFRVSLAQNERQEDLVPIDEGATDVNVAQAVVDLGRVDDGGRQCCCAGQLGGVGEGDRRVGENGASPGQRLPGEGGAGPLLAVGVPCGMSVAGSVSVTATVVLSVPLLTNRTV